MAYSPDFNPIERLSMTWGQTTWIGVEEFRIF
jgi:hypothetical protein